MIIRLHKSMNNNPSTQLSAEQGPVYVVGHINPDTDSIISGIFIAWASVIEVRLMLGA